MLKITGQKSKPRVGANRERVVIEQERQAVAAIISYEELKQFET
ncbi:hypothetical protein Cri9333_2824 [Crinalium epipsammum PCC 9333]|uniref:Uncharacterized protein n=1 Tax=Crinalium epipsammum PCC 9333 TaxID=1173022 RepID=K9VZW3_9CYAN|nr:hypothetical protein [Crinalium epipsammum]AFZ13668.1 hypothetical protein Cri9333_2824 [Crinalium epipsammum PCC 9333]